MAVLSPGRERALMLAGTLAIIAWGRLLAFLSLEWIVHPALYYETGSVAGALILAYDVLTLAAIIHAVVRTPRAQFKVGLVIGQFRREDEASDERWFRSLLLQQGERPRTPWPTR